MNEQSLGPKIVKLFPGDEFRFSTNNINLKTTHISEFIRDTVTIEIESDSKELVILANKDTFATFTFLDVLFIIYPKILSRDAHIKDWAALTSLYFIDRQVNEFGGNVAALFGEIQSSAPFDLVYFQLLSKLQEINRRIRTFNYQEIEEEVSSVKGRINFNKSIQKFAGLHHKFVTTFDQSYFRDLLAPVVKAFAARLISLIVAPDVKALADNILAELKDAEDITLDVKYIEKCRTEANLLRRTKTDVLKALDLVQKFIESVNANTDMVEGFSLRMDHLFQELVFITLGKLANKNKKLKLCSGNNNGEDLKMTAVGKIGNLSYQHMITFEPDAYFLADDTITNIFDAKYKAKVKVDKGRIKGVLSSDLYQMMAYAAASVELNAGICPRLMLVYPMRTEGELFAKVGSIKIEHIQMQIRGNPHSPEVEIVFLNVQRALKIAFSDRVEIVDEQLLFPEVA